ncbi:MAG: magnesium/cobalt transporter CorA [Dehalococcoidia bacterium]
MWIDIENATVEDGRLLADILHFHPLAIADCISKNIHPPKIDEFEDHIFIVVHGINYHSEADVLETAELGLFLGKNYVVTSHDVPMNSVSFMKESIRSKPRRMRGGADFLAYDLIDRVVDFIMPVIDTMQEKCEEIEIEAIEQPSRETIATILKLKRSIMALNRIILPQRDILNSLSRGDFSLVSERALIYYRNIYDHIVRIAMSCQEIRDLLDNVLSTYLSSVANRQNQTMKVLAIVAAIFMPLTLVAGIYGMNFENMPELKWEWGYFGVVGIIGTVILIMLWIFWARNWITVGRRGVSRVRPFIVDPHRVRNYIDKLKYHDGTDHLTRWYKMDREDSASGEGSEDGKTKHR